MAIAIEIKETSKQITAKERVALKHFDGAAKLDELTKDGPFIFKPDWFAKLLCTPDDGSEAYEKYLIVTTDGQRIVTGSASFWHTFADMFNDMEGETEDWSVKAYQAPSKNRTGAYYLTCDII